MKLLNYLSEQKDILNYALRDYFLNNSSWQDALAYARYIVRGFK